MTRDLDALTGRKHDVLVVGAGIHGAFAAWDAALRGLSVAIVDGGDFGGGASANSLKIIHGGLRYLQQPDVARMRESIRERAALLRIAPALVRPLPFVIATRGMGKQGAAAMGAALWLTDRIGFDRNAGIAGDRRIPDGRLIGRDEVARLAPDLPADGATGGALWYDGQAMDADRLTLACVRSAAARGAAAANYVRVAGLIAGGDRVEGARAVDEMSGRELAIRARVTIVACGGNPAWLAGAGDPGRGAPMALAMNLVTRRPLAGAAAFGVRFSAPPDPGGAGGRYLFVVPWRASTMIGTFYRLTTVAEAAGRPTPADLAGMLDQVRSAMPAFALTEADVRLVHAGLLPLEGERAPGASPRLAAHASVRSARAGEITMIGVKFTTARHVARIAVDRALDQLGRRTRCATHVTPLDMGAGPGAQAGDAIAPGAAISADAVRRTIRDEMALRLADVILRRTPIGGEGCPPRDDLDAVARVMAAELGWDETRRAGEIHAVRAAYAPCGAHDD
ncbi:MAG: FAD-dependent oxidoreductase [Candidatus Eisenbacteria bacterium]|nr:FAD-dependent oxidoreductase [Candidatus Eisenbacteria bacterium]